jgi:hypothetical protein
MQLASRLAFPEPLLAAMPQLREKPHLGFRSKNPAWHPGFNVCNSTAVLGLQFRCSETVSGPVVAPNNGECDNACQLAHAFNKTGVYSLTSVCFPVAFYGASAAGATGALAVANAPEVYAATAGDYATWYGRAVSWLSRMVGKTPSGAGTAIAAAPAAISQFCSSH